MGADDEIKVTWTLHTSLLKFIFVSLALNIDVGCSFVAVILHDQLSLDDFVASL
jgi:hypothetical protein